MPQLAFTPHMHRKHRGGMGFWYDLPLIRKGMTVISIPLLSILLSLIALYVFQRQRDELDRWIERAFQAGSRIQSIVTLLVDAQDGSRGYLLTRQATYLEPLRRRKTT